VELLYPARDFDKFLPKDRLTYFIESRIAEFEDIVDGFHFLGKWSRNTRRGGLREIIKGKTIEI
jgi:hypothetical protein